MSSFIVNYSLVLSSSGESCFSANTSASLFAKGNYRYLIDLSLCDKNLMTLNFSATNKVGAGASHSETVGM